MPYNPVQQGRIVQLVQSPQVQADRRYRFLLISNAPDADIMPRSAEDAWAFIELWLGKLPNFQRPIILQLIDFQAGVAKHLLDENNVPAYMHLLQQTVRKWKDANWSEYHMWGICVYQETVWIVEISWTSLPGHHDNATISMSPLLYNDTLVQAPMHNGQPSSPPHGEDEMQDAPFRCLQSGRVPLNLAPFFKKQ